MEDREGKENTLLSDRRVRVLMGHLNDRGPGTGTKVRAASSSILMTWSSTGRFPSAEATPSLGLSVHVRKSSCLQSPLWPHRGGSCLGRPYQLSSISTLIAQRAGWIRTLPPRHLQARGGDRSPKVSRSISHPKRSALCVCARSWGRADILCGG